MMKTQKSKIMFSLIYLPELRIKNLLKKAFFLLNSSLEIMEICNKGFLVMLILNLIEIVIILLLTEILQCIHEKQNTLYYIIGFVKTAL